MSQIGHAWRQVIFNDRLRPLMSTSAVPFTWKGCKRFANRVRASKFNFQNEKPSDLKYICCLKCGIKPCALSDVRHTFTSACASNLSETAEDAMFTHLERSLRQH
jgi:hypothetical protein